MLWLHTESLQEKNNAFSCPTTGDDNTWKLTGFGSSHLPWNCCSFSFFMCNSSLNLIGSDLSIIHGEGFIWLNPALYNISQRGIQVQKVWYNLLILKRTLNLFCLTLMVSFCSRLFFKQPGAWCGVPGTVVTSHICFLELSLEVNSGIYIAWSIKPQHSS